MELIYLAAKLFDNLSSKGHAPSVSLEYDQGYLSAEVGGEFLCSECVLEMVKYSTHFRVIVEMEFAELVDNLREQVLPDETLE